MAWRSLVLGWSACLPLLPAQAVVVVVVAMATAEAMGVALAATTEARQLCSPEWLLKPKEAWYLRLYKQQQMATQTQAACL